MLVHAISPRVAIVNNGAKKGGSPSALDIIKSSPNLEAMWQLHFSEEAGAVHNSDEGFIASQSATDIGDFLQLTAQPDGSFSLYNPRTKFATPYAAKR